MDRMKSGLILKIVLLGLLLALLAYVFHPDGGHVSLTINGEPVTDPLARIAAVPVFLAILLLTGLLAGLVILGMGTFLLIGLVLLGAAGIALAVPTFWPVLLIVIVAVSLASLGGREK
jgi:hypothetical protein